MDNMVVKSLEDSSITPAPIPWWTDLLTLQERENISVGNLLTDHYQNAPIPGRNLLVQISKMAEMLHRISQVTGIDVPALYAVESTPRAE